MERIEAVERQSNGAFKRDEWPRFDKEEYSEAMERNMMSISVVLDESRQGMLGMPRGEVYDFGEAVREKARALQGSQSGE